MSCLSPAPPRGLQAVIPVDPPPSKREKVARYLQQKKEQFDQYQRLLNQQRTQLMRQRQDGSRDFRGAGAGAGSSKAPNFYRLMSTSSFTTFARASQQQQQQRQQQQSKSEYETSTNGSSSAAPSVSEAKTLTDKNGEKLVMFPSYARRLDNGLVEIDIRGWVYAPGGATRKNKIFTSVVRQLVGVSAAEAADSDASSAATVGTSSPASSIYGSSSNSARARTYSSIPKNTSSISVGSVISNSPSDRGSPSPSRRGSFNQIGNRYDRSSSPVSEAVMIPRSAPKTDRSVSFSRTARSYSHSPGNRAFSSSPRRDTYSSAAQQARGIRPDDISGAVINNKNFVQPTLVGERQPLLSSSPSGKRSTNYLINLESDTESDYFSSSDDDEEVIENHHQTVVVDRRASPARSMSRSSIGRPPLVRPAISGNDIRRQQSFYSNQANGSMTSIAGHNSEVVAANADNAPLSSPTSVSRGSYFPDYTRRSSILSLSRSFSMNGSGGGFQALSGASPARSSNGKDKATKDQAAAPPPLPPRPNLISFPSVYNAEKTMQERIAPFISRPISYEAITINVGSTDTEEYSTYNVFTADSGHFGVRLRLNYEPSISCVECGDDLITVQEVKVIEPFGVSVISDVDDTIKHTGITGAKKGIFRNVFVKDYSELEIKGVASWYQRLSDMGCPIHYVSNSPWQLFPSISKFLRRAGLPGGSMHLKHYNGFLYGLLEPAVERKRFNLESILADFPHRKFILVGDSGEMDLEAYVNLACNFPDQVLAIYIRDVTTMCSDDDDACTMSQLNGFFTSSVPRPDEIDDLLVDDSGWCCGGKGDADRYYNRPHSPPPLMPKPANLRSNKITTPPGPTSTAWNSTPTPSGGSIKQQQQAHEAPKVPKKPSSLKSQPVQLVAPQPTYPTGPTGGATCDLLSSSAASSVSPLAARLAEYSSTFESGSPESPEMPSYMSGKQQQQQPLLGKGSASKLPSTHVTNSTGLNGTTGSSSASQGNISSLSTSIKAAKSSTANPPNYNSIQQQEHQHQAASDASADTSSPPKKRDVTFSDDHDKSDHHKPPLPPRPADIARSVAGAAVASAAGNKQHASDIASYAYRACIGQGRGNSDNEPLDKKLALWKKRVARARMMLPNGIRLRMWRIGDDVGDECEGIVKAYLDQLESEMIN
ncbi:hypothetical protein BZA70DRAFT_34673 [Myxozyma melibiosi]|uniref:Phosphatidate phosphatase APP1 catalytic domain-containing protein n=1 Tax=Myxozyma melibiosi TaxID=54550 RepID=A0ABR1FE11_9ASCO